MPNVQLQQQGQGYLLAAGTTLAKRHTAPATTGEATLVPDRLLQPPCILLPNTSRPYATTSGCSEHNSWLRTLLAHTASCCSCLLCIAGSATHMQPTAYRKHSSLSVSNLLKWQASTRYCSHSIKNTSVPCNRMQSTALAVL